MSTMSTNSSSTSSSTLTSARVNAVTLAISQPPRYNLPPKEVEKSGSSAAVQPPATATVTSTPEQSQPSPPQKQTQSKSLPSFLTLLTTILITLTIFILALCIIALSRLSGQLSDIHFIALYLNIFIYFVLGLLCLFGAYTFFPRNKLPRASRVSHLTSSFAAMLVLAIGVSIFGLVLLFRHEPPSTGKCTASYLAQAHDKILVHLCTRSPTFKGLSVLFLLCIWFVDVALVIFSSKYGQHVSQQEEAEDPYCYDDRRYWGDA